MLSGTNTVLPVVSAFAIRSQFRQNCAHLLRASEQLLTATSIRNLFRGPYSAGIDLIFIGTALM